MTRRCVVSRLKQQFNYLIEGMPITRDGVFATAQIDLIAAGISLQRGKLAPAQIRQVDAWLKRAATKDARALRVVNEPD